MEEKSGKMLSMVRKGVGRPREASPREIRDIARRLFSEQGYSATSLSQIAEASGISRTTLFTYFPAKHDLLWEEFDKGVARVRACLAREATGSLVDTVVDAMVEFAEYPSDEHEAFRLRLQLIRDEPALRAYTSVRTHRLIELLTQEIAQRVDAADRVLVDHTICALVGVAARCIDEWADSDKPGVDLPEYLASGLEPFAKSLRPLLPDRD